MNKLKKPLVIVANGEFPSHPIPIKQLEKASFIIACDGAANTLIKKEYKPNIIIGDLDSISEENKIKYKEIIIEDNYQSENDFRKAINYAVNNNINAMTVLGAVGKREDHAIGNIFSLLNYKNLDIKIYTDNGIFSCIHSTQSIKSFKGEQVSIFALDSTIKITSNNLKYNFNNSNISSIYKGTLNESLYDFFKLKISHGSLLIYQAYKK